MSELRCVRSDYLDIKLRVKKAEHWDFDFKLTEISKTRPKTFHLFGYKWVLCFCFFKVRSATIPFSTLTIS